MFRVVSRSLASRVPVVPTRAAFAPSSSGAAAPARSASTTSSIGTLAYQLVFKRNVVYVSAVFFGAICFDAMFGPVMKGIWRSLNYGRTFGEPP